MFYAVRVASNQERILIMIIADKVKRENLPIKSILFNENVKGYLFFESDEIDDVLRAIYEVRHVKGIIREPISKEEIDKIITIEEEKQEEIEIGDIVKIVSGAFKGEIAKVVEIDKNKQNFTVVPLQSFSVPIKIKINDIKLVEKKGEKSEG